MRKFVIVRDLPNIGNATLEELRGAARKSNATIAEIGSVKWEYSYVTANKTYCIYFAEDEDAIRKHAEISGFPITEIAEIFRLMDPSTANE